MDGQAHSPHPMGATASGDYCRLTSAGQPQQENFPVALRALSRPVRRDLLAIYRYARLVDDLGDGDGVNRSPGDRLALLAELEQDVHRIYHGAPVHPAVRGILPVVRRHAIPIEPLLRLVAANQQDQTVTRYATMAHLLAYCELSANPVGHLVLHVFGAMTPRNRQLSDDICTGLQLVEHWQDVAEDLRRGRIYLPQEDMVAFGVSAADLSRPAANPQVRALLALQTQRAAGFLDRGAPLAGRLRGAARLAVAGFVGGGRAAAAAITAAGYDPLARTPKPSKGRVAWETAGALLRRRNR